MTEVTSEFSGVHPPLRVGEILDRGFGIALAVTRSALGVMLVISALEGGEEVSVGLLRVGLKLSAVVANLFSIVALYMAVAAWRGERVSLGSGIRSLRWELLLRSFSAAVWIGFFGMLRLVLLVYPAFNYWLNYALTPYLILVEGMQRKSAMERSRYLMTREPWYSLTGAKMRYSGIVVVSSLLSFSVGFLGVEGVSLSEDIEVLWVRLALMFSTATLSAFLVWGTRVYSQVLLVGFYNDLRARYEGADLIGSDATK
jgi:hypothetical protein